MPLFGPPLPSPPVFTDRQEFRDFLLVKRKFGLEMFLLLVLHQNIFLPILPGCCVRKRHRSGIGSAVCCSFFTQNVFSGLAVLCGSPRVPVCTYAPPCLQGRGLRPGAREASRHRSAALRTQVIGGQGDFLQHPLKRGVAGHEGRSRRFAVGEEGLRIMERVC